MRLVRKRGQYMQEAVPPGVGAMAAILKLPEASWMASSREAAQGEVVSAANLNSPDQVVIAGHAGAVNRAIGSGQGGRRPARRAAAGQRALPLRPDETGAGAAARRSGRDRVPRPRVPLVNNWQAREIRTGAEAREGLYQQVPNPVRWVEPIRCLASQGVTRCVEVGAGRRAHRPAHAHRPWLAGAKFGEPADLDKL